MMLVVVFSMVAFTIDIGYILHVKTELQRTADSCALASVMRLPDKSTAQSVALYVAQMNTGTAGPDHIHASDVEFGIWDRDAATFTSSGSSSDTNAVQVSVRRTQASGNPLDLFFAPILGRSSADVTATATAMYDRNLCGPLVGIEWVLVPGDPIIDSYYSSQGAYSAQTPRDHGSLCSDGPINVDGGPNVNGDANPGKGYTTSLTGNAVVTGNKSPRLKPLNLPPVDVGDSNVNNDNNNAPLIPKGNSWKSPIDADGNFLLDAKTTYSLSPGTYYFNDLTLTGQSVLNLSGETTIYLTGNLDTAGGSLVNGTEIPSNLKILMTGGTALVTANVAFYGVVYGPNTDVTLAGAGDFYGAAVGKTLEVTGTGDIHYDEDLDLGNGVELPLRGTLVQ